MEDILRAIVLGVVQGLTEFLPISSSGHLILVRELFDWDFTDDLTFDVALHVGTTVAVLAFFWRDWLHMLRDGALWLSGDRERRVGEEDHARVLLLVIVGSIPIAIIGFVLQDWIEDEIRDPVVVGVMLIVFAGVLFVADSRRGTRSADSATVLDAVIIGGAQAVALIPGVSRSGITISAGLFRGLRATGGGALLVPSLDAGNRRGRAADSGRCRFGGHADGRPGRDPRRRGGLGRSRLDEHRVPHADHPDA